MAVVNLAARVLGSVGFVVDGEDWIRGARLILWACSMLSLDTRHSLIHSEAGMTPFQAEVRVSLGLSLYPLNPMTTRMRFYKECHMLFCLDPRKGKSSPSLEKMAALNIFVSMIKQLMFFAKPP